VVVTHIGKHLYFRVMSQAKAW